MNAAAKVSKRDRILWVLLDGQWHSGSEFLSGQHGFRCSSYSQRIGDLIERGENIERDRHGDDGLGRYRLVREGA